MKVVFIKYVSITILFLREIIGTLACQNDCHGYLYMIIWYKRVKLHQKTPKQYHYKTRMKSSYSDIDIIIGNALSAVFIHYNGRFDDYCNGI